MGDFREHIIPHTHLITKEDRVKRNGYKPQLIWFTGLSGSGKSTLASRLEHYFFEKGFNTYILDGDNVRKGLNKDLDFSSESRVENIRRIAEVGKLFVDSGVIVITAFISPFEEDRKTARNLVGSGNFIEVYVDCPLKVCEERDVKGLYKKARAGEIQNFTGINSPFERPSQPDISVNTADHPIDVCLEQMIKEIEPRVRL